VRLLLLRLPLRLKRFWRRSQTRTWAYTQVGCSAALTAVDGINHTLSNPVFKSYLDVLALPRSIIIGIALFGMATFIFHGHD
jgi:hypothetical protein